MSKTTLKDLSQLGKATIVGQETAQSEEQVSSGADKARPVKLTGKLVALLDKAAGLGSNNPVIGACKQRASNASAKLVSLQERYRSAVGVHEARISSHEEAKKALNTAKSLSGQELELTLQLQELKAAFIQEARRCSGEQKLALASRIKHVAQQLAYAKEAKGQIAQLAKAENSAFKARKKAQRIREGLQKELTPAKESAQKTASQLERALDSEMTLQGVMVAKLEATAEANRLKEQEALAELDLLLQQV